MTAVRIRPATRCRSGSRRRPERIYDIVTDIAQMGRLSPECTGGKWLDGATGPAVGARFKGSNKRGFARWSTTNKVVEADPGRAFSFETQQSAARWTYRMQPDGTGTLVTESREMYKERPLVAKVFTDAPARRRSTTTTTSSATACARPSSGSRPSPRDLTTSARGRGYDRRRSVT